MNRYRIIHAQCQFCGKKLDLQIDPSYYELGDPYKLIKLAACNRCADLKEERRNLEQSVRLEAIKLEALRKLGERRSNGDVEPKPVIPAETEKRMRERLEFLTKRYCLNVAQWTNQPNLALWDPAMVGWIMERPEQYAEVWARIWVLAGADYQPLQEPPEERKFSQPLMNPEPS